jgi:branched-chain amino acid transport system substrate-binding protein
MLKIGVLLPRSTLFPAIGLDFLNGIKAFLQQHQLKDDCKLITDNIGFGTDEAEIYTKAEKLILQEDVDIAIVFAGTRVGEMLEALFTASNKILLLANMGANFPESWQPAPTTIVHTLNFCLHTRLTGKLAAMNEVKDGAYVTSYYDAGYKQCYSMLSSHQQNGGIPHYTHVTHFKPDEFSLEPLNAFISEHPEVKNLLCLFAGDLATKFYLEIVPLQNQYGLQLYVSPMMLDQALKEENGELFSVQDAKGYTPWLASLQNESNQLFLNAFLKTANKKANLFALLGWDTGALLQVLLQQNESGNTGAAGMLTAIGGMEFKSPRGWMKLDAATFHTYGPSWLVNCHDFMELDVTGEMVDTTEEWNEFTNEKFPDGESSNWRNTYLCI